MALTDEERAALETELADLEPRMQTTYDLAMKYDALWRAQKERKEEIDALIAAYGSVPTTTDRIAQAQVAVDEVVAAMAVIAEKTPETVPAVSAEGVKE